MARFPSGLRGGLVGRRTQSGRRGRQPESMKDYIEPATRELADFLSIEVPADRARVHASVDGDSLNELIERHAGDDIRRTFKKHVRL